MGIVDQSWDKRIYKWRINPPSPHTNTTVLGTTLYTKVTGDTESVMRDVIKIRLKRKDDRRSQKISS